MAKGAATRRYAKALFQLASEQDGVAGVHGELLALADLLRENASLRDVLLQPLHPAPERRRVLEAVAERIGASPLFRHFGAYLIDQRRLVDFESIREEYERLSDEAAGLTRVSVRAASPLSDAQRASLERALARRVGGGVELQIEVDPSLIGGLVAKVGDTVFDGSLLTQLQSLRSNLG